MNIRRRGVRSLSGLFLLTLVAAGCETSSVRHHRSYEYHGSSPPPPERAQPSEREELESDYEMVKPGEMVFEPD